MERVAHFEKVSTDRFINDFTDAFPKVSKEEAKKICDKIKLPRRATSGSAGYDFFMPLQVTLSPGETAKIPTGIRAKMREDYVLMIYPRSGLGFKYRLQLNNTVGIIDSDYYGPDNEGHIFIKLTNAGDRPLSLRAGEAFAQGVFVPFGITGDDDADGERTGGFGSTNR